MRTEQTWETVLREYKAMISEVGSDKWTARTTVLAESPEEAREKLEAEYGEGTVFYLHNEEDASRPR
jgi:hypothetical protein